MINAPGPSIFVVEDDATLRTCLAALLTSVGHKVQAFESVEEFDARHLKCELGCLILDVRLGGMSGLQYQQQLVARQDPLPIIFVTGYGDIAMCAGAMKAGAVDFLAKPVREQELLDAVQTALRRDALRHEYDLERAHLMSSYQLLTPREREIMALVVSGMLNKQIAAATNLSEVTVKIHRAQVMHKMNAPSLPSLVRMADRIESANSEPARFAHGQF
ncbi:MAG: response regulator [Alphaproteobacteria bacterium]